MSKKREVTKVTKVEKDETGVEYPEPVAMIDKDMSKPDEQLRTVAEIIEEKQTATGVEPAEDSIAEGDSSNNPLSLITNHLKAEPALAAKLLEALETGRWLVTVHFLKKYTPTDEHDLHHFEFQMGYPKADVVSSLKTIASAFSAREFPNAEVPDDQGWH